jgi:hypothetical protein
MRNRKRWSELLPLAAALVFGLHATGCPSDDDDDAPADTGVQDTGGRPDSGTPDTGTPDTGTPDTGTPDAGGPPTANLSPAATGGFETSFDGVVFGADIFFVGVTANGPAVLRVPAAGGAVTPIFEGDPLGGPIGIDISIDGTTLYVSDPAGDAGGGVEGAVFALPTTGATPTAVTGTEGAQPVGLVVVEENSTDMIYFSGTNPATGLRAVMRVAASGGAVTVIAEGAPFDDLSGIAVDSAGTVFVVETSGTVYEIPAQGAPAPLVEDIAVGYPAGIALTMDELFLIVSALDPVTRKDILLIVDLSDNSVRTFNTGIENEIEPAGLHRAHASDDFAWSDMLANRGAGGRGTVFHVTLTR